MNSRHIARNSDARVLIFPRGTRGANIEHEPLRPHRYHDRIAYGNYAADFLRRANRFSCCDKSAHRMSYKDNSVIVLAKLIHRVGNVLLPCVTVCLKKLLKPAFVPRKNGTHKPCAAIFQLIAKLIKLMEAAHKAMDKDHGCFFVCHTLLLCMHRSEARRGFLIAASVNKHRKAQKLHQ